MRINAGRAGMVLNGAGGMTEVLVNLSIAYTSASSYVVMTTYGNGTVTGLGPLIVSNLNASQFNISGVGSTLANHNVSWMTVGY